jgi:hypothetical protein
VQPTQALLNLRVSSWNFSVLRRRGSFVFPISSNRDSILFSTSSNAPYSQVVGTRVNRIGREMGSPLLFVILPKNWMYPALYSVRIRKALLVTLNLLYPLIYQRLHRLWYQELPQNWIHSHQEWPHHQMEEYLLSKAIISTYFFLSFVNQTSESDFDKFN